MKKTFLIYFDISALHIKLSISHILCIVKCLPKTSPPGPCGQYFCPISVPKNLIPLSQGKGAASPPAKFMATRSGSLCLP